jgi:hypothetical protein
VGNTAEKTMENNKTEILEMKNRDKEGWAQQYN